MDGYLAGILVVWSSLACGQRDARTQHWLLDGGLIGQAPIKCLIASIVGWAISRRGLERRDVYGVSRIYENRDKLRVVRSSCVQLSEDCTPFPSGSKPFSGGFSPKDSPVVARS